MRMASPVEYEELPETLQIGSIEDPYPYLAAARERGPVTADWPFAEEGFNTEGFDDGPPAVSVLGFDEVATVLRDHETYSSAFLSEMMTPTLGRTIVAMDEPDHRATRALVAPAFRPKLLAKWQDALVRHVVDELIDDFAADGEADLVRQLTFAFPVRVIARILGLPAQDAHQFQRWSLDVISLVADWDRGVAASQALGAYFAEQLAERRAHPRDDLISELAEIEVDGERLDDEDIFGFLRLLLPAGIETTYRSFGNLLFGLLTHPEQLEAVRGDASLRKAAIEEGLRWETPIVLIARRCVRDTQLGGVDIVADQGVTVFLASANRDERRFPDADRFDIHREPAPHLSFGSGPHMCLGIHLARMESLVALDAVLERLPDLQLDPTADEPRIVGSLFRSPSALRVRF
jgi:cytochrome P450